MVPAGIKTKRLSLVNHTAKTIHDNHHHSNPKFAINFHENSLSLKYSGAIFLDPVVYINFLTASCTGKGCTS